MSPERPAGACPRCGADRPAGREHCLTCGLAFPDRGRRPRPGPPAGATWSLLALLVVAACGALVAVLVSQESAGETLVATRVRIDRAPPRTASQTTAPAFTVVPAAPATVTVPTTTSPPGLTTWTLDDGYTVVLASIATTGGRDVAVATAKRALAQGLAQVGVLESKSFSSLAPGYLVVFSGVYASSAAATAHLAAVERAGFSAAYERRITR